MKLIRENELPDILNFSASLRTIANIIDREATNWVDYDWIDPAQALFMTLHDAQRVDGQTKVCIPVRKKKKTRYGGTGIVHAQGSTGGYYNIDKKSHFYFPAGADEILVPIDFDYNMQDGQEVTIKLETPKGFDRGKYYFDTPQAKVTNQPVNLPAVGVSHIAKQVPKFVVPSDYTLDFNPDLVNDFIATDTGFDAQGNPCWKQQPAYGPYPSNHEGYATTEDLKAQYGINPFPIVNGVRTLRAQELIPPYNAVDVNGDISDFKWTGPILTTETLFRYRMNSYVEVTAQIEPTVGAWHAIWAKCSPHQIWPPEQDHMEWGFPHATLKHNEPYFTDHTVHNGKGGAKIYPWQIVPGFDINVPHKYGFLWSKDQLVWVIDDIIVHEQPNFTTPETSGGASDEGSMYLKLHIQTGGGPNKGGNPGPGYQADMNVHEVKVWQST